MSQLVMRCPSKPVSRVKGKLSLALQVAMQKFLVSGIHTVDGRNPANQLRLVVYPIVYKVFYIPGG